MLTLSQHINSKPCKSRSVDGDTSHTLYKYGTKNVRRKTNIYLYHQLIKSGKEDVWDNGAQCLPGTALYFLQA